MGILSTIQAWFTQPRQFTDTELLQGPEGDCIDHGFDYTEEEYIRTLVYRKSANQLSERQNRLIDTRIAELQRRIIDREAYKEEQRAANRRRIAEEAVNEIAKKPTPSVRVPQNSGSSTAKFGERLADRIADAADSIPTHTPSPSSHSSSPSHSVSYSSHKSCHSSSYDGGSSSSHSSSSDSSSSSGGCD